MNDERLYIDGELVDIDDTTKITMDIKSNLFRDVSQIVSNSTYTVKLPKTVRPMCCVPICMNWLGFSHHFMKPVRFCQQMMTPKTAVCNWRI